MFFKFPFAVSFGVLHNYIYTHGECSLYFAFIIVFCFCLIVYQCFLKHKNYFFFMCALMYTCNIFMTI